MLTQRAAQFRSIQKRLLTRFKDKTPAPLQNLDTLLEGTYRQVPHYHTSYGLWYKWLFSQWFSLIFSLFAVKSWNAKI